MNANELRIGNWVKRPDAKTDYDQIGREDFLYQNGFANIEDFDPIPLTEEWLLRGGFVNFSGKTDYYFKNGEFIIGGTMRRLFPSTHGEYGLEGFGIEIRSVHQLQNLYFALTGQELEFSE